MSAIAVKQSQEDSVDVNNFWRWPTSEIVQESVFTSRPYMSHSSLPMCTWFAGVSTNGYIIPRAGLGSITADSMTSGYQGGYIYGLFLDVEPGMYLLTGDADVKPAKLRFGTAFYTQLPDGNWSYENSDAFSVQVVDDHSFSFQFEVKDGRKTLLVLGPDVSAIGYSVTFTNLKLSLI